MSTLGLIAAGSLFCLAMAGVPTLSAQTADVSTKEAPATFKSTSNLVLVPVVVRDGKGHAVGSLGREDFQLLDNGRPQVISKFTVEKTGDDAAAHPTESRPVGDKHASSEVPEQATAGSLPDRFVAYLFDDVHMKFSDLVYPRDAAKRQIDSSGHVRDRVAIYTTSGQHVQDFTNDREKLHAALAAIGSGSAVAAKAEQQNSCPPLTYYMAQLIEKNVMEAWVTAMDDLMACGTGAAGTHLAPGCLPKGPYPPPCPAVDLSKVGTEQTRVTQAARSAILAGDRDTEWSLDALHTVVNKMATMPGQRSIVLISPGFLVPSQRLEEESSLIERAVKAHVVIGALDARGLYTRVPGGDASERGSSYGGGTKASIQTQETMEQAGIMDTLAAGTGGTFFKGTNDFDEGLARTAAAPEYLYVLGFTPQDLKLDGNYHSLKVTLRNSKGLSLQVRKGYYAAKYSADPKERSKQQMEEAFFSHDEIHDLPAVLDTQYFKLDNGDVRLSAVATIDVKKLAFRKEDGRDFNEITVETGLFDDGGNFVTGFEKTVTLRLADGAVGNRLGSGIAVKSSFSVHPGRYEVRMVVRDSGDQLMAAQSRVVDIP